MIRAEVPRIAAGVSAVRIAQEWNERGIPTVNGGKWRTVTVKQIFLSPRICGHAVYRGEVMRDAGGNIVRGEWEPILTEDEHAMIVAKWPPGGMPSRLGGRGQGSRTSYLLSPFLRCGKCGAKMTGSRGKDRHGNMRARYRCPAKADGGCGSLARLAEPVEEYITALVIAEQQQVQFAKLEDVPPWPGAQELAGLQARIEEQQREYEAGRISGARHFSSLERMEAGEARLLRDKRQHEGRQQSRRHVIANLAAEWNSPGFTLEQKQAAIAQSLTAIIINPAGRGGHFHPDQIVPVFRD